MDIAELKIQNPYVKMTIDAGVPPLELQLTQVDDLFAKDTIAYRTTTVINSVLLGTLRPKNYEESLLKSPVSNDLVYWGIKETIELILKMDESAKSFEWISYKCSTNFAFDLDLYKIVKDLIERYELKHPEKLCIEFDGDVLNGDIAKFKQTVIDLNLLNVRTLISGCGSENFSVHLLSQMPISMVILDPIINEQVRDKEKRDMVASFINYLSSMKVKSILSEIYDDLQLEPFEGINIYGFIPSNIYVGSGAHSIGPVRVADVI